MNRLKELLARVEAATGPDTELDKAIAEAFGLHCWAGRLSYPEGDGRWLDFAASNVTDSVDAALALVDREMPGWRGAFWKDRSGEWSMSLDCEPYPGTLQEDMRTAPLAILAALLRAKLNPS